VELLEGKLAVVTGGSRGIGLAIARAYIDAGARVIVTGRDTARLAAATAGLGANAIGIACDNSEPGAIEGLMDEAFRLGGPGILVNNAGVSPYYKRAEQMTAPELDELMQVNLRGTFLCSTAFARRLFEFGRPGSIINISSVLGAVPTPRLSGYAAVKAAINQATKAMALEWADRGVRVNAIAPGWTETDFTEGLFASRHAEGLLAEIPMGRWARPQDVVGAALYLASEASAYVTGTVLAIDGGRSLR
jgi:NAD(P)-dependent dehydrogenase (short-subunit alcohol dehydrogenase family)